MLVGSFYSWYGFSHTFGSEAGIGEVIRFGSGLADLEFGFLRGVNGPVSAK